MSDPLVCAGCGADNRPNRTACWRCYAPLPRPAVDIANVEEPEVITTPPAAAAVTDASPPALHADTADQPASSPVETDGPVDDTADDADTPPVLEDPESLRLAEQTASEAPVLSGEADAPSVTPPPQVDPPACGTPIPAGADDPADMTPAVETSPIPVLTAEPADHTSGSSFESESADWSVADESGKADLHPEPVIDELCVPAGLQDDVTPDTQQATSDRTLAVESDAQPGTKDPEWDWPLAHPQPTPDPPMHTPSDSQRRKRRSAWRWIWALIWLAGLAHGYRWLTQYLTPPPATDAVHDVLSAYRARDWEQMHALTSWDGAYEYLVYRMHDVPRLADVLTRVYSTLDEPVHPLWRPIADWQVLAVVESGSGRTARATVAIRDAYTMTPQLTTLWLTLRNRHWLMDISTTDPIPMRALGRIRTEMNN